MEKVHGIQIFKKWDEMGESNRISLIKRLTQWERELCEIQFPAYGSLYYKSSLSDAEMIPLDSSIDPGGEFCIGPSCDPSWLIQRGHRLLPDVDCGPCMYDLSSGFHYGLLISPGRTLCDFGESLIERSLSKASQFPNKQLPACYMALQRIIYLSFTLLKAPCWPWPVTPSFRKSLNQYCGTQISTWAIYLSRRMTPER
jgi:hypothetical protein